jgi:alpha-amylase
VNTKRLTKNSILSVVFAAALSACGTGSDAPPGPTGSAGSSSSAGAGGSVVGGGAGGSAGGSAGATSSAGIGGTLGSAGTASNTGGQGGAAPRISGLPPAGGVFVHLFEWKWTDIAAECENYLGPAGFAAVQVSPPSEHAVVASSGYPWWQRYQTVSYSLAQSRSGTAAEFADMVQRCARVGVGIYVDAVINHMTGGIVGSKGSNGTVFSKYDYPGVYASTDFHPFCTIMAADYSSNADHVRVCELSGLADLKTDDDSVRDKIAGYLSALTDLGVAGFRVDAAKHMYPADLDAIVSRVNQHAGAGHAPFFFFEVIDGATDIIHVTDYTTVGVSSGQAVSVTDFQYSALFDRFVNQGNLADFSTLSSSTPALPSAQALVFTTNHDTERGNDGRPFGIYYQDGKLYDLATVFLLAWPYGYPSLMSSYAFDRTNGFNQGPPSDNMGHTNSIYAPGSKTPNCAPDPTTAAVGTWVCQHRDPFIAPMLAFRKATLGAEAITNFWSQGSDQIAFGRGAKGFVVINRAASALSRAFTTSLPAGSYCDVIAGGLKNGACVGATVVVGAGGMATISAPPVGAVVIHTGQKQG